MLTKCELNPTFLVGFASGAAFLGVTLVATVAMRRMLARRADQRALGLSFIDREPDEVELQTRPAEEGNTSEQPPRLESELPEFSPMSQRW